MLKEKRIGRLILTTLSVSINRNINSIIRWNQLFIIQSAPQTLKLVDSYKKTNVVSSNTNKKYTVHLQHASKSCNIHRSRPPDFKVKGLDISSRHFQLIKIHTNSYHDRLLAELTSQLISVFPASYKLFIMCGEKRGERITTRCNNIDVYCQFRCLILTTVSTCFGYLYAHHQEKKTTCYCIWGCLLVVLDVAGCGTVVLRCRVWALWRLL